MKTLPEYASQPLRHFVYSCERNSRLLHLSMRGIRALTGMANISEILLVDTDHPEREKSVLRLAELKKEAELAESEEATGYPLLHAHALVAAWGSLEAAIEDMLVGILVNEPSELKKDSFAKIRVPLADFEARDQEDRMRFLLTEIQRGLGRRNGISAFEGILAAFDLSGDVDEEDKKLIWEMHHLRNVIVHRNSRADRRLVDSCPWLNLKLNDEVTISHSQLRTFFGVLHHYVLTVTHRLGKRYDIDTVGRVARATAKRTGETSQETGSDPKKSAS
jgi:hypothetical protein